MEIIDGHQHVGDLSNALGYYGEQERPFDAKQDAANRVAGMQALGIDAAVIQPSHGYLRPDGIRDTMQLNDRMAAYRRLDPEHFVVALGTVEPLHGERSLDELDRMKVELGLNGVSWHHRFHGCYIDNRWMWPILRRMAELQLVPLIHVNAESNIEAPWRLQRLAREFPELSFLALDGLWTHERAGWIMDAAESMPNVLWDLGGPVGWITVDAWVRRNGSRNITFSGEGAYGPTSNPKRPRMLDEIERSRLSDEDKANILGGNVRRLFRL